MDDDDCSTEKYTTRPSLIQGVIKFGVIAFPLVLYGRWAYRKFGPCSHLLGQYTSTCKTILRETCRVQFKKLIPGLPKAFSILESVTKQYSKIKRKNVKEGCRCQQQCNTQKQQALLIKQTSLDKDPSYDRRKSEYFKSKKRRKSYNKLEYEKHDNYKKNLKHKRVSNMKVKDSIKKANPPETKISNPCYEYLENIMADDVKGSHRKSHNNDIAPRGKKAQTDRKTDESHNFKENNKSNRHAIGLQECNSEETRKNENAIIEINTDSLDQLLEQHCPAAKCPVGYDRVTETKTYDSYSGVLQKQDVIIDITPEALDNLLEQNCKLPSDKSEAQKNYTPTLNHLAKPISGDKFLERKETDTSVQNSSHHSHHKTVDRSNDKSINQCEGGFYDQDPETPYVIRNYKCKKYENPSVNNGANSEQLNNHSVVIDIDSIALETICKPDKQDEFNSLILENSSISKAEKTSEHHNRSIDTINIDKDINKCGGSFYDKDPNTPYIIKNYKCMEKQRMKTIATSDQLKNGCVIIDIYPDALDKNHPKIEKPEECNAVKTLTKDAKSISVDEIIEQSKKDNIGEECSELLKDTHHHETMGNWNDNEHADKCSGSFYNQDPDTPYVIKNYKCKKLVMPKDKIGSHTIMNTDSFWHSCSPPPGMKTGCRLRKTVERKS